MSAPRGRLTHLDAKGAAAMVDVGEKAATSRSARAEGLVLMQPATLDLIASGQAKKGDVVAIARIAGIMAAKRTSDLIPLCHPLMLEKVDVRVAIEPALPGLRVTATAKVGGKTGVEMEALTAVSVACLTVYDMAKAVDRSMEITGIRLLEKSGGQSGDWSHEDPERAVSLIAVETALEELLRGVSPVAEAEELPLRAAAGRVLAAEVRALRTQPDFDASAMDGYALRADDAADGRPLRLVGTSAAGRAYEGRVGLGEAVRIFTGAPVPDGADTVLIQENAERLAGDHVRALEPVARDRNIRRAGNDFSSGQTLLPQGARLTAGMIALAASGGHPRLTVLRRPRVAILATGDELVEPGALLGPSQIVASNSYGVAALVDANGGEVLDLGIARDDLDEITGRLDQAKSAGADILVTIGGASVGDHDLAGEAFRMRGVTLDFWKVAMRPGKPIIAGRLDAMRILGLPGNPASSMVAATVFLRPLLRRLAGLGASPDYRRGRLGIDMPANDHRAEFVRATLQWHDGEFPDVMPLARQDSSLLSIYAAAAVLLLRPADAEAAPKGTACRYLPLD